MIPKLEGRMEIYAKKLRDFYIREGVIPDAKIYLDSLRERQPEDTIDKCIQQKEVPGNHHYLSSLTLLYSCDRSKR
jgi:hypothetical protein